MPATEQTWRNQKRLHFVFAISGVLLLATTIWMFSQDHDRQWKGFQKAARATDLRLTDWRKLQEQTDEYVGKKESLEADLAAARSRPLDPSARQQFWSEVETRGNVKEKGLKSTFDRLHKSLDDQIVIAERERATYESLVNAVTEAEKRWKRKRQLSLKRQNRSRKRRKRVEKSPRT